MRHRVYGRHFGRNKNERTSLFRSLVNSLFTYGTIETSESKAKAIKGLVDKIINLAKTKSTQHLLQAFFANNSLKERLIKEVAPKFSNRQSGYTSLVRLGSRQGDRTVVVRMSLIGSEKMEPMKKESRVKSQESSKKLISTGIKKPEEIKQAKKSTKPLKKGAKKS